MGTFIYGGAANSVEIDDRTLAHLRIVVSNKLRRAEPFMFDVSMGEGRGHRTFWVHPSIPMQFQFAGSRQPQINRAWIELLMSAASRANGLTVLPEPTESSAEPAQPAAVR